MGNDARLSSGHIWRPGSWRTRFKIRVRRCSPACAERGQILGPRHLVPTALYRALSSVRHCVHVAEINLGSGVALGGSFSILDQRCAEIVVLLVIIAGLNLGPPLTKEGTPCLGQQNPPATNQSPH